MRIRKKLFKETNAFSLYNLSGHAVAHEPMSQRGMKLIILLDLFTVIISI